MNVINIDKTCQCRRVEFARFDHVLMGTWHVMLTRAASDGASLALFDQSQSVTPGLQVSLHCNKL
jgi:hypothetical protein